MRDIKMAVLFLSTLRILTHPHTHTPTHAHTPTQTHTYAYTRANTPLFYSPGLEEHLHWFVKAGFDNLDLYLHCDDADMEEMLECDVKIASKEDRRRIVAAAARLREKQG